MKKLILAIFIITFGILQLGCSSRQNAKYAQAPIISNCISPKQANIIELGDDGPTLKYKPELDHSRCEVIAKNSNMN